VAVESSATAAAKPGEPNSDAVPCAAGTPAQLGLVYTLTVVPSGAPPWTFGPLSFAGETGSVSVTDGAAGAIGTTVTIDDEPAETILSRYETAFALTIAAV
jgi:hypothetical protein